MKLKWIKIEMNRKLAVTLTLAVMMGCATQPKKEATITQNQESTVDKTNPQAVTGVQASSHFVPKIGQITVSIVDASSIADRISGDTVQIDFKVDGIGADLVTLLCRSGEVPDVWHATLQPCNKGTRSHSVSKLSAGHTYAIGVVAQNPETGIMTDEVSATFTVSLAGGATTGTPEGQAPLLMRQVGQIWRVYIPTNMYIQGYTTNSGLEGGVDLYQAKDDQTEFIQACTDSGSVHHNEITMKDSLGTDRTYCHINLSDSDFATYTEHRIGRNYLTVTTPLTSLSTPGFDSAGHYAGFQRLVVNAYNSRALGGDFNSDFTSKTDLFMTLCSGNASSFVDTDLPASLVQKGRSAKMRVCRTHLDFGLAYGSKDVWLAQILALDSNKEIDTEIIYMTQWESATTAGNFADNVYRIVWTYFQPVNTYFESSAISVPANLPAPVEQQPPPIPVIGVPPNLGTI